MAQSEGLDIHKLFPIDERMAIWKKSNIMFKANIDRVIRFWNRLSDYTRGTIIKTYNKYIYLPHNNPCIIHVSDIVRYFIYGETLSAVIDEHRLRILARGLLYHHLFRKKFADRVKAAFELPIACTIYPYTVVGTVDVFIPSDSGRGVYILEVKSSSTETTLNFGVLQVKAYWCMLEKLIDVKVVKAYVVTPKTHLEVSRPVTRRELKRMVELYASALGRAGGEICEER